MAIFVAGLSVTSVETYAAFTNYNSMMLGDRAGGMGSAFTSLTGDTAAGAFYNPATLARLEGSSLSAAANLFNKYDVTYGDNQSLDDAIFRINRGSILSVPSSSGIFSSFRNFSAGVSIVVPDYQVFGGDIYKSDTDAAFLRLDDQSLWIGGAFAFNLTEKDALGFTVYYTSQSYTRSLTNRYETGGETVVLNEEKTLSTNSFIYILGYYHEISDRWRFGTSYRFRSIPVNGRGSYLESQVGTVSGAQPLVENTKITAETQIPNRWAVGVSYEIPKNVTVSCDVTYYGGNDFYDLNLHGDRMIQRSVVNYAFGLEKYFYPWLSGRFGLFTDFSSSPKIPSVPLRRYQDHLDKYGFSANMGIATTEHTTLSLGGYYLGGSGWASERVGAGIRRIRKTERVFSFLVGSSVAF